MNKFYVILRSILMVLLFLYGQQFLAQSSGNEGVTHDETTICASSQIHDKLLKNYPEYAKQHADFEKALAEKRFDFNPDSKDPIWTIPLVVHIIHNGEPEGAGTNITDAQIYSAIHALNEDYRKMAGTNGDGDGVDVEIEFCLAVRDPQGNPTTGINRVDGSVVPLYSEEGISAGQGDGASANAVRSLSQWPREDYYNIWVVSEIEDNDAGGGIQGYAYFPTASASVDGTVILFNAFGTEGVLKSYTNMGRTLTHELGHAFYLYHTFQGGSCATESNCETQGDRVCDTPPTSSNNGCTPSSCPDANVENYMDYSHQTCKDMFTQGQKTRMRNAIQTYGHRTSLLTSLACTPVYTYDAGIEELISPDFNACSTEITPEIKIRNYGSATINSLDFTYNIDAGAAQSYTYNGSLVSGATEIISLPTISTSLGSHSIDLNINSVNGQSDQYPSNNTIGGDFNVIEGNIVQVDIEVDNYGSETTWDIKNDNNEIVVLGGPYPSGISGTIFTEYYCLEAGCYDFTIYDTYGDGIWGGGGFGGYEVTDQGGNVLASHTVPDDFEYSETTNFCITGSQGGDVPVADFASSATAVCVGNSLDFTDESTGVPTSWLWTFDGAVVPTSNNQNPSNIVYDTPGTYDVTLTVSNSHGTDTQVFTDFITVGQGGFFPSASVVSPSCGLSNGSITLTVSGGLSPYTYEWSNGASSHAATGLAAGTIGLTITDAGGCSMNITYNLEDSEGVSLMLLNATSDSNNSGAGSIDIAASGGSTPYTYAWTGPNNYAASTLNIANLFNGTYDLMVTDNDGCTAFISVTLVNENVPSVDFESNDQSICVGESVDFTDLSVGGVNSWLWTFEGGTPETSTSQHPSSILFDSPGTYAITLIASNANGSSTETKNGYIVVNSALSATSIITQSSCNMANGSIDLAVTGGVPPYTYVWSNGASNALNNNIASGTYSVNVTDANGCSYSDSYTINDITGVNVSLINSSNDVSGAGVGSISINVTGGVSPLTYQWTGPNNFNSNDANIDSLNSGTYVVVVTDANGCTNSLTVVLSDTEEFFADFESDVQTSCTGVLLSFTDLSSDDATSWLWEFPGAANQTSTLESPLGIYYNNPGVYTVTLTVSNGNEQASVEKVGYITIVGDPNLTSLITEPLCNGTQDGIIDLSVSGGNAPYNIEWSNSAITEDLFNVGAGVYSVSVTDNNGCESSETFTVEEPEVITINVISNIPDQNNSGTGAIDVEVTGGVSPYEMTWTENGDIISNVEDIYDLLSGTYVVNVLDANGCSQDETITVLNFNGPTANFTSNTSISCAGQTIEFTDISTNNPISRIWEFEGGIPAVASGTNPSITYTTAGTYSVTLTVINAFGTDTETGTIVINNALEIEYVTVDPLCSYSQDGEIDISAVGGSGTYNYLWSMGSTFEDLDGLAAGTYTVLVGDQNSCTTQAVIELVSPEEIEIEIAAIQPDSCNMSTGMVELSPYGGTPGYTVLWDDPQGQVNFTLQNVSAGTYTASVVDANFCTESITVNVQNENCVGLDEIAGSLKDIVVYPNPSSGERLFFISDVNLEMNISMFDVTGREIGIQLFDVSDNITELYPNIVLSNGIYFVKFKVGDEVLTKKISVNK